MIPPVERVLFSLGPLDMHWYGLLIAVGILLGGNVAAYLAKQDDQNPEYVWDMLFVVVLMAVVGARVYHVFSQPVGGGLGWLHYKEHPWEALYIWKGGLGIYGAIGGGVLGVLLFARWQHLQPWAWLDYIAPAMALGQAIGRWGNYMNRELFGPPTTLPWGLLIPARYRIMPYTDMVQYPETTLFHPTFLYESLAALALCLGLLWLSEAYRGRRKVGDVTVGYLMGYSIIRFCIEFLRPDAWMVGTLAAAQVIALVFIVGGAMFLLVRYWFMDKYLAQV